MATYNRSNVLRIAIETVRWQTIAGWELLVIGDHCTDDTAEVVAGFADPRIRFVNLPENFGEQSGPNNVGVAQARGRHVAFLNHDDLWWPDHLETCLGALDRSGADLVFGELLAVGDGGNAVIGKTPDGRYDPRQVVPASAWVGHTAAVRAVGPWRPAGRLLNYSSQEWLFRAHWAGADVPWSPRWMLGPFPGRKRIRSTGRITVVQISSVVRPDTYRERRATEQEHYFGLLASGVDPRAIGVPPGGGPAEPKAPSAAWLRRRVQQAAVRVLLPLGVAPGATRHFLRFKARRGAATRALRRTRGLAPGIGRA